MIIQKYQIHIDEIKKKKERDKNRPIKLHRSIGPMDPKTDSIALSYLSQASIHVPWTLLLYTG